MSAQRLREATKVLRERAEAATPGAWEAWQDARHAEPYVSEQGRKFFGLIATPSHGNDDYGKADAAYIATMHPGVGLALADLLDGLADDEPWDFRHDEALAIANLILGGGS